jgi:AraC family transcriptional regulator
MAKSLMLSTSMPLSEIALNCGMADQAHFTRIFRQSTGDTPARWRAVWAEVPLPTPALEVESD